MFQTRQILKIVIVLCLAAWVVFGYPTQPTAAQSVPAQADVNVAVGPQYDSTHVYVSPESVGPFAKSFLGTFGGKSSKQAITTVTPGPSRTTSQLLQTPVGTVSLFGYLTPIPAPFGDERNGYLVRDMDAAVGLAHRDGAEIVVAPFSDPIGRDAVIRWPGGVLMQLYWHTNPPSYAPLQHVPENRVYLSADAVPAFERSIMAFSNGRVVSDDSHAPGDEIGMPGQSYRRICIQSLFGKMLVSVTDGHLPYPYGRETTDYEVDDLGATLAKAKGFGVTVLVEPFQSGTRRSAMLLFPGGYIAELHSTSPTSKPR